MRIVIADTSPINYLLLIGYIDILPALFDKVILPVAVRDELGHPKASLTVRNWVAALPPSLGGRAPNQPSPRCFFGDPRCPQPAIRFSSSPARSETAHQFMPPRTQWRMWNPCMVSGAGASSASPVGQVKRLIVCCR